MSQTKPWWSSLAVWAALVTLVASALRLFRIEVDPAVQRDAAEWLLSAATLAGGAGALWGRWRANRRIGPAGGTGDGPGDGRGDGPSNGRRAVRLSPLLLLLAGSGLAPVGGCSAVQALQGPGGAYVAADRATYEAVAPEYSAYVAADPKLSEEQRARRDRAIQTWRMRVEAGEGAGGGE
jgi:hypothetical protein